MADIDAVPTVPLLTRWGVAPDADLVFRALASFGRRTAAELAAELGMSRRRVDSALEQLHAHGIAMRPGKRDRPWRVADAAEVLKILSSTQRRPAHESPATPPPVTNLLRHVPPGKPDAEVRYLPTRDVTRLRLAEIACRARREHLSIHPERTFEPAARLAAGPVDRIMADRRIPVRVLGVQPEPARPAESWDSYRKLSSVPMKLIVIDREIALFPLDATNYERGYIEIAAPAAVHSLVDLFEEHWQKAEAERTAMSRLTLSSREQQLIELLAGGLTDAGAARNMHISERSVSTIMRSLMDRAGVDNRFQLGLVLGAAQAATPPARTTD
jgi:DNA-binding CsgD family transcriptional regulator